MYELYTWSIQEAISQMRSGIYLTVNVAQSLNGIISGVLGRRAEISGPADLERVHRLRSESDAILVGANTINCDNPTLKVNGNIFKSEKNPMRIVLDRKLSIRPDSKVLDGTARTLVFTGNKNRKLKGAELIVTDEDGLKVPSIVDSLSGLGVRSLLVEGGSSIISQFLKAGIVDEFYLYIGNILLPESGTRLFSPEVEIRDFIMGRENLGDGILIRIDPSKAMVKV